MDHLYTGVKEFEILCCWLFEDLFFRDFIIGDGYQPSSCEFTMLHKVGAWTIGHCLYSWSSLLFHYIADVIPSNLEAQWKKSREHRLSWNDRKTGYYLSCTNMYTAPYTIMCYEGRSNCTCKERHDIEVLYIHNCKIIQTLTGGRKFL